MVVFRNILISAVVLILFGWGMISFYGASMDIAEYSKDTTRDYIFEINVTPILAIICVVGILAYISYSKKKKVINHGQRHYYCLMNFRKVMSVKSK